MDAYGVADDLPQVDFYKKYFYRNYDGVISLGMARAPHGTITTVPSDDYIRSSTMSLTALQF
jgi:hypothetical protein